MKKAFTLFIGLLCLVAVANSQAPISYPMVDAQTYAFWQKGDWRSIISLGKQALKNDIDFYYLRVRMGIAYYERKNYHMAIHHFEKAYAISQQEAYLKEYLYYSYLFAGRDFEASIFRSKFSPLLQRNIGKDDESFIDEISLFYSYSFLSDNSAIDNYTLNIISPNDGTQEITRQLNLFNIGLKHKSSPKFSLFHSYTNIQKNSFEYIVENGSPKTTNNLNTSINQYYLLGDSRIAKNLNWQFGFHVINIRYPVEVTFFRQGQQFRYIDTANEFDFVGFTGLYRNFSYTTIGTYVFLSGLNGAKQLQGDLNFSIYPLGNLNLYSTSTASIQMELYPNNTSNNHFVYNHLIGFKTFKFLWVEGFISTGSISNYIASNGAIVFNGTESIKGRFGGRIIFLFNPKLSLQLAFTRANAESAFIETYDISAKSNFIKYSNNSITGGIVWKL